MIKPPAPPKFSVGEMVSQTILGTYKIFFRVVQVRAEGVLWIYILEKISSSNESGQIEEAPIGVGFHHQWELIEKLLTSETPNSLKYFGGVEVTDIPNS